MARKKHAKPHEEEAGEAWLLPYSDLMTLLLALFIALFAMSQTDASKMQALAQAFTAAFNMGGPSFFSGMGPSTSQTAPSISGNDNGNGAYMKENENLSEAQEKLEQYIKEHDLQDQVSTELSEDGLNRRVEVFIARSMRFSQEDSSTSSDGKVVSNANAPSTSMPKSAAGEPSANMSVGTAPMGAEQRPTQTTPGVVPAPLQH